MQQLFSLNKWTVFGFICLFSLALSFAMRELVITLDVYYEAFGEQMTWERLEARYKKRSEYAWVSFFAIPLVFVIKFTLITTCLYTGAFLKNLGLTFRQLFGVVVVSEVLFLLPTALKVLWFVFVAEGYTLEEVIYFSPWALSGWVPITKETDRLLVYLLQVTNLFEVLYIFLLAFGLQTLTKNSYSSSLTLTLKSYGLGLVLWITFVSFLIVSFA